MFSMLALCAAEKRFLDDAVIMDSMAQLLWTKNHMRGVHDTDRLTRRAGWQEGTHTLRGIQYPDTADLVLRLQGECAAFGFNVSPKHWFFGRPCSLYPMKFPTAYSVGQERNKT